MEEIKKTILVVGGAGFIGSHINKMLHQAGYQTIVLDNLSIGNQKAVTRGIFIEGDIADTKLLNELFNQYPIDAVMHFAAFIDVGESIHEPYKYYLNNVANTINLLEQMRHHDVKTCIFSSTAAVFGIPQTLPVSEEHPCLPINPYGASKLMVERILKDFDQAYGIKSSSLRYFNAAGGDPEKEVKNFKKRESNLIPLILRSLKNGGPPIKIFGTDYPTSDGTCIRDYIHILDLGQAHIKAMERLWKGEPSASFNLGNGNGFSVREVIRAIEKVTGMQVPFIEGIRRAGDPPILVADAKKAKKILDWRPNYPELEQMIQHAWDAL